MGARIPYGAPDKTVVVGHSYINSKLDNQGVIAAWDKSGKLLGGFTVGGDENQYLYGATFHKGGLVAVGYGRGADYATTGNGNDGFVVLFSADLKSQKQIFVGTKGEQRLYRVGVRAAGALVATGQNNQDSKGLHDAWLINMDPAGKLLSSQLFGGTSNDHFWGVLSTPDGTYAVGQQYVFNPKGNTHNMLTVGVDAKGALLCK